MKLFTNILVPIDFSDNSKNALKEAGILAKKHNGKLTLIHVINMNTTPTGQMNEAKTAIHKELNELCEEMELEAEVKVDKGIPAEGIVKDIEDNGYSICIMGTHERHDIISELVGTVALKVIQHAAVPVLTIPGATSLHNIDKVVFATDFKKIKDNTILNYLRELCLSCDAELHLLNINESPESITEKEAEEALELHQYLFDVNHAFFFSKEKDTVKGIMNYMKEKNIDLLAMMPRKHGFFDTLFNDSTTDQIALHLGVPLFSFHE